MADYQHILLAVDFSDQDTYVARKAERLATFFNAKLSIIHVLDNIPMPDTAYGTVIPLYSDSSYELLEIEKNKLIQTANRLTIDPANRWLIWGKPEVEIIRIANEEGVDLIVVGSHGRHGLALLLGSTASGVLHHAQCDVLAVRLQDEWAGSVMLASA
ncbi:universal stress protein [Nitrosomonas sp. Is37]|uniref:universal stress protein n=1 Tax=Nitrosomonas sp. Is37 TaxID=3080535 RepID=UPI00294B75AE|nr:universal stress protein [Nitrosomonas sp. Is37]MDV6344709.1 universal stress protein [Nitrosomonas sp. Is37]